MANYLEKQRLIDYESNPFRLSFSVVPIFFRRFKLFNKVFWFTVGIVLASVVVILLPVIIASVILHNPVLNPLLLGIYVILGIVILVIAFGYINSLFINMALVDLDEEKLDFWQLVEHSRGYIGRMIGLNFLFMLLFGGLALSLVGIFFIPYFALRFALAPFLIIHENCSVFDAFTRSGKLVQGRMLEMFGLMATVQILSNVVAGPIASLVALSLIFLGIFALAAKLAWLAIFIGAVLVIALCFLIAVFSFLISLAYGKRYIQLHNIQAHGLKPNIDTTVNVIMVVAYIMFFIFSSLIQLVFSTQYEARKINRSSPASIDRN